MHLCSNGLEFTHSVIRGASEIPGVHRRLFRLQLDLILSNRASGSQSPCSSMPKPSLFEAPACEAVGQKDVVQVEARGVASNPELFRHAPLSTQA